MVMKKKYGADRMRRFLVRAGRLSARLVHGAEEGAPARFENENQMYIHYQKGSIALYALQDYIGEDHVNAALKSIVDKWNSQGPPYPTTKDLMAAFPCRDPAGDGVSIEDL